MSRKPDLHERVEHVLQRAVRDPQTPCPSCWGYRLVIYDARDPERPALPGLSSPDPARCPHGLAVPAERTHIVRLPDSGRTGRTDAPATR